MKRFLLAAALSAYIFALAPAIFFAGGHTARAHAAEVSYARATAEDAYFFLEKDDSSSIFIVPYTYCIEILRDDGDWYYASYASNSGIYKQVRGYCRKQDFSPVEGVPEVVYLYKTVTVTYRSDEGNAALPTLDEITVEAAFYGNFYSGATAYSYVYAQGSFGYIKGATVDFPLIRDEEQTENEEEQKPTHEVNFGLVTALGICALAAVALIMLYCTTRKKNKD